MWGKLWGGVVPKQDENIILKTKINTTLKQEKQIPD